MSESESAVFPALFRHHTRADWGVSVLSGERDGKRVYLFEGGEERLMGSGSHDMMRKIPQLDAEQQRTLVRLTALLARRHGVPDSAKTAGLVILDQVTTLRGVFPQGLLDPAWQSERRAAKARDALVAEAQASLSLKVLDAQLKAQQFEAIWASVSKILGATGWLPADHLKAASGVGGGTLPSAVRELLYGSGTVDQRIDRFSIAFETALRRPPRWEVATGLLSLVDPAHHVLVDVPAFRKQLKILGSKGTLSQNVSGAGYVRCLSAARMVASKLAENGEVPQDLLDVHDFIRFTLKAAAPTRRPKAPKAVKKKTDAVEADVVETEDAEADAVSDSD